MTKIYIYGFKVEYEDDVKKGMNYLPYSGFYPVHVVSSSGIFTVLSFPQPAGYCRRL